MIINYHFKMKFTFQNNKNNYYKIYIINIMLCNSQQVRYLVQNVCI